MFLIILIKKNRVPTPLLVIMACCEVLTNESKKGRTGSASVSLANSKNQKVPTKPKTQTIISVASTPQLFWDEANYYCAHI